MVKYLFPVLALQLIAFQVYCWEFELNYNMSIFPSSPAIELSNGEIVVSYIEQLESVPYDAHRFNTHVLHLNSDGTLIDTLNFTHHFPGHRMGGGMWKVGEYLFLTGLLEDSAGAFANGLIQLNEDLQVVFDTIYEDPDTALFTKCWMYNDSLFLIQGFSGSVSYNLQNNYLTYWKINKNFKIVDKWVDSGKTVSNYHNNVAYDQNNDLLYHIDQRIELFRGSDYKTIDTSGNLLHSTTSWSMVTQNGHLLVAGRKSVLNWPLPSEFHLYIHAFDTSLIQQDSFSIYLDSTDCRPADFHSLTENNDAIFFGASKLPSFPGAIFQTIEAPFILMKLNKDMELQWIGRYGDASNSVSHVSSTKDGGVILCGLRWDWKTDSTQFENSLYVVKVDANGNSTGLHEMEFKKQALKLYPNPAQEVLNVELSNNGNISFNKVIIRDVMGKTVCTKNIRSGITGVDVSSLPQGAYVLSVIGDNSVRSERFIKK